MPAEVEGIDATRQELLRRSASVGGAPPGPRRHRRPRRWPRRLLVGLNIMVLVALAVAGGGYLYVRHQLGGIHKINVAGTTLGPPGQPENILVVGSDSRAALAPGQASEFGSAQQVQGQRSDVIILVHLVPATGAASMLSIPRDTWVPIAGTSSNNRINSAFDSGPGPLVQTITAEYHIAINHYVEVNFDGFQGLVNAVGGICMSFADPVRDTMSGLHITATGPQQLDGAQALSLARSRDYQYFQDGYWHYDGTGDLGRIRRQHVFLRVLMAKAISAGIHNPLTANALVGQAVKDVTVDQGLSSSDILGLVTRFHSLSPSSVPSWTMPAIPYTTPGGAAVLMPERGADAATVAAWEAVGARSPSSSGRPGTSPARPAMVAPSSVSVEVENGSGAPGQAAQAAQGLRSAGFGLAGTGDASSFAHTGSVVSFGPGQQAAAETLAAHVEGPVTVVEDTTMGGSAVLLVTGSGFQGISATASSAPPPPVTAPSTTTAGPAPSTGVTPPPPYDPTAC